MLIINEIVRDVLFVKIPKAISESVIVKIINSEGSELLVTEYKNGCAETIEVNTRPLKNGMYFFQLIYGKRFLVESFVKKNKGRIAT